MATEMRSGGSGVMALGGGLELGAVLHDAPGGACGLRVDAEWILGTEVEIALDSETESDPDCGHLRKVRVA